MVCLRWNTAASQALAAAALVAAFATGGARAAETAQTPAPPPATREPAVQHTVTEDDNVRIEELRVRGLTRKVVVQPKIAGAAPYEIQPLEPGRDTTPARGGSGQRVWRILSF